MRSQTNNKSARFSPNWIVSLFSVMLLIADPIASYAQVRLSKLFQDGMVMQREMKVPVWGWADKGERISVEFNGQTYKTKTESSGRWVVYLPEMEAGGSYELIVAGKNSELRVEDVWIGDVWICSGQSNMEWVVANSNNAENEIADARDTQIRHFKIPHSSSNKPEVELAGGSWQVCSPETVGSFTAVGYYFARELRKHADVPIGLINTSWGGSRIEPWMSSKALGIEDMDNVLAEINKKQEAEWAEKLKKFQARFDNVSEEDAGMDGEKYIWTSAELDESDWQDIDVPKLWELCGYEGLDGIGWYRTTFELNAEEAKDEITLGLARIDDSDIVWINGVKVGGMEASWNVDRLYTIDPEVLKTGVNMLVVRVEDTGGGGGIYGEKDLLFVKTSERSTSLAGTWKFRIGAFTKSFNTSDNHIPTLLYNKMIYPILDYPIKGALWYQGESNAGNPGDAVKYKELFQGMIEDWRTRWDQGNFPFLYVQLANFMAPDEDPSESAWALLRESQSAAQEVEKTGQAVIIDIGEADDIHPRNKQDVGKRLSLLARKIAYGENILASGPVYKSHKVEGKKVYLEFNNKGGGLLIKDKYGYMKGFALAGADKKFYWARGTLEEDKVVVWSDMVPKPVAVRYAWGNNPDDANLYNLEDLPASPFRADEW